MSIGAFGWVLRSLRLLSIKMIMLSVAKEKINTSVSA